MKKRIKHLTFCYLIFLVSFIGSSAATGTLSDILYACAFVLLTAIGIGLMGGEREDAVAPLKLNRDGVIITVFALSPTVIIVASLSYLSALLLFVSTGNTDPVDVGDSFLLALISWVLVPAVTEEILFRYLPLRMLGGLNKRVCIILSATFFSLAHFSPFQLIYAFVAGAIFMIIDLSADSIVPSLIIHFANTLLSLSIIMYGGTTAGKIVINVIVSLLLCLSLVIFIIHRKIIIAKIRSAFSFKERYGFDPEPLLYIIPALTVGLAEFLS